MPIPNRETHREVKSASRTSKLRGEPATASDRSCTGQSAATPWLAAHDRV